ncbi:putative fatty acyl-CoA reductase CG5065 [Temnothorax curvispinosus]|uniref:Fatty acyl-CoA reductase n=1 Tax=Temnothorax curvispinosus TaxID=300111 RepID=A0A6J1QND8_9HYME|nr:putative fatty acyl-CoA reductase CG5065 [Temnothorax curvispinosus]
MAGENTSVKNFYKDRSIFITGATGFMGKVLVEKLLRSCPEIKNIYLLMRPKRGQNVQERLQKLLNEPLFETLRRDSPGELTKMIPVAGDITQPQLGISIEDKTLLIQSVSIVFHLAATINFNEALKLSVTVNTLATKRLVQLFKDMHHNVEAFIHVSTAYCNCDQKNVAEEIYSVRPEPDLMIALTEGMDDKILEECTPILIGSRPNTYTFTKALAERMLQQERGSLPVAIVRPSIVTSSYREPVAGWTDNYNGPTGLVLAAGKGVFRTMLCHEEKVADLVPVDIVINLMICAAWRIATQPTDSIPIYNCCTGSQNPITWKQFIDLSILKYCRLHPMDNVLWYPDVRCHRSSKINTLCVKLQHNIPAYILDTLARLKGSRPRMVSHQTKLSKAAKGFEYFTTNQWSFWDNNVQQLCKQLSPEDRNTFMFNVRQIDWPSYLEHYILGIRQFILRESPDTLPAARSRMKKLYWIHKTMQLMGLIIMLCVFLTLLYFILRTCGLIV